MNILYGLYQPDEGEIIVNGKKLTVHSSERCHRRRHRHGASAFHAGAGAHRHRERDARRRDRCKPASFSIGAKSAARIRQISEQFGLPVDPDAYIKDLPVGVQQRVEIIKLLYRNADILILDEPTAVLTPQEADELVQGDEIAGVAGQVASSSSRTSCAKCW